MPVTSLVFTLFLANSLYVKPYEIMPSQELDGESLISDCFKALPREEDIRASLVVNYLDSFPHYKVPDVPVVKVRDLLLDRYSFSSASRSKLGPALESLRNKIEASLRQDGNERNYAAAMATYTCIMFMMYTGKEEFFEYERILTRQFKLTRPSLFFLEASPKRKRQMYESALELSAIAHMMIAISEKEKSDFEFAKGIKKIAAVNIEAMFGVSPSRLSLSSIGLRYL